MIKNSLKIIISASIIFIFSVCSFAQENQINNDKAVSNINSKIFGGYADFDANATGFGGGSLTMPLGDEYGLSLDAVGGEYMGCRRNFILEKSK